MDIKRTRMLAVFSGQLLCMLMLLFSSVTLAQQSVQPCQLATIKASFQAYLQTADRQRVARTQQQLNALGYGPVAADGVLGIDTRLALQHFCQASDVQTSTDSLAEVLVELLDQAAKQNVSPLSTQVEKPTAVQPQADPEHYRLVYYRWLAPEEDEAEASSDAVETEALPDELMEKLGEISGIAYPNQMLFKYALANLFASSGLDYRPYEGRIVSQARMQPDEKPGPIQVRADGCGCSRDFSSLVYGFYPSWLAADKDGQTIDFSLFDRIGFYALSLNQDGDIQNPLQWSDESNAAGFINKAHKYMVDVDTTIYANGWQTWNHKLLMRAVLSTLDAVTMTFTPLDDSLISNPTTWDEASSVQGDGVTLVFDGYGNSVNNRSNVIKFVTELVKKLAENERHYQVNIVLDLDVTTLAQQTAFKDLDAILLRHNGRPALVDNVFVFLQQPTSKAKKILRRSIEDEFRGAERKAVMRKIVPVISPHDEFIQFTDDLIYFQDNFAGVGLWPLPLAGDEGGAQVKDKITELYTTSNDDNYIGGLVENIMPGLCQFACPNRWLFRVSFDLMAGLILLYAVLAIWIYRLRNLYNQYFWFFLAAGLATLLVFLVSLICDPYWQARADVVIALLMLAVVAAMIWRYVSRAIRPPLP